MQRANALACLRLAVQECGYTHDALAAAMGCSPSLITRMLNGERDLKGDWRLPDDVEFRYFQKRVEALGGVAIQRLSPADAATALASAVLSLSASFGLTAGVSKVIG